MAIINPQPEELQDDYCTRRRRLLLADLRSLSDRELQEIGLQRSVIPDATETLLANEGCHPHKQSL